MGAAGNKLKNREIKSFSIDKVSLQKILNMLILENKKAQEKEIEQFRKSKVNDTISDDDLRSEVERNLKVSINVWGRNGEYSFVNGIENLKNFSWPSKISMIMIENHINFNLIYKFKPANSFFIRFDFSNTDILDLYSSPTLKTFNDSKFEVIGIDEGWVHGVEGQLNELLKAHESPFWNFIHTRNIYDILLWFLFVPIYVVSMSNWAKRYPYVQDNIVSPVQPLCFLVLLMLGFYIFRIFFNITKRIFPFAKLTGELKEKGDVWTLLRGVLYFVVTTIIAALLSGIVPKVK